MKIILRLFLIFILITTFFLKEASGQQDCNVDSILNHINSFNYVEKTHKYLCIGDFYEYKNQDSAIYFYNLAVNSAKKTDSTELLVNAYNHLIVTLLDNGQYTKAIFYIDTALTLAKDSVNIAYLKNNLATIYSNNGLHQKAFSIFSELEKFFSRKNDLRALGAIYTNISSIYSFLEMYDSTVYFLKKTLKIDEDLKDSVSMTFDFMNLGIAYTDLKQYDTAEFYLNKALDFADKYGIEFIKAEIFTALAIIEREKGNFDKAKEFYLKSININRKNNNINWLVQNFISISNLYQNLNNFQAARKYLDSAEILLKKYKNDIGLTEKTNYFESRYKFYTTLKKYDSALVFYKKFIRHKDSLSSKELRNKLEILQTEQQITRTKKLLAEYEHKTEVKEKQLTLLTILLFITLGMIAVAFYTFIKLKRTQSNLDKKNQILKKALEKDELQLTLLKIQNKASDNIYKKDLKELLDEILEDILNSGQLCLENKAVIFLKNSKGNLEPFVSKNVDNLLKYCSVIRPGECLCGKALEENKEILTYDRPKYGCYDDKDYGHFVSPLGAENKIFGVLKLFLPKDKKLTQSQLDILKQLNFILTSTIERKLQNEKIKENVKKQDELNQKLFAQSLFLEQQKIKLEKVSKELEKQTKQLSLALSNLRSSVNYASYIVKSMLPDEDTLRKYLNDVLLIFKPAEIIGGDFYYIHKINDDKLLLAVGDATGHGVPGALLATQAITFIRTLIYRHPDIDPITMLNKLRDRVKKLFDYAERKSITYNGFDLALSFIDKQKKQILFSGANMCLMLIRDKQLIRYKGVKSPIGTYIIEREFKQTLIKLEENDLIYFSTDGYFDQLGGKELRKFGRKNFERLIVEISDLPLKKQKQILVEKFENWKNSNPQVDDVTVLAFRWKF